MLSQVLEALDGRGLPQAEVYAKRGRSRSVELTPRGTCASNHREEGWAVRAGDDRRSMMAAATGRPDPAGPPGGWPEADGDALELPGPERVHSPSRSPWRMPSDLEAPLVGEREAVQLLALLGAALEEELPGARLLRATLTDGASEVEIANSLGVEAAYRTRAAHLRAEAAVPGSGRGSGKGGGRGGVATAAIEMVVREARNVEPRAVARRLADRLVVGRDGRPPERDRVAMLLAPAVTIRLLEGLLPLFVGPQGTELSGRQEDRQGRFASSRLTVRDDGRLEGGALVAPADGEGMPTGEVTLVDGGVFRQPLLSWNQSRPSLRSGQSGPSGRGGRSGGDGSRSGRDRGPAERGRAIGCARRPSWRDLPRPAPSHLYVAPAPEVSVRSLLTGLTRGVYLLDADGAGRFDFEAGRFELPVLGFAVDGGSASHPIAGARVTGAIGALLRGIEGVGRDLSFLPAAGGLLGAPTLLVTGLEIVPR